MIVTWSHNSSVIMTSSNELMQTGNTVTLLIGNFQPPNVGIYQCVFNDTSGSGWILRRNIRLIIQGMVCT